ncbi:MAG: helix-turn-helix domain-containing protein [Candidatus Nitronauta litoralis]|uniref:Helix-turn-helix domain-containing protein n=1 Tax=Candidatus Nitronauta litoralis TaxID=2705533 RepID=A0A7T0BZM1_9BACT|nr:MAG: helix-turn-helix domain-containing protein [Candidatus Nitronauta litoralis]
MHRKLRALDPAKPIRNVSKTFRYFRISRTTFYEWRRAYEEKGESGLINRRPGPAY